MLFNKRFVWLVVIALAVLGPATEAGAAWAPAEPGPGSPGGAAFGPEGGTPNPTKGGIDPEEPAGPARLAGDDWSVRRATSSQTLWQRLVETLLGIGWIQRVIR